MIKLYTDGVSKPSDNGLLERIESQGDSQTALNEMLALIHRTSDLMQRDSCLNEEMPDETDEAVNALATLQQSILREIWNNETGQAALNKKASDIGNYHDERRQA